jgi:hypothetical protein
MQIPFRSVPARALLSALALSCTTLVLAAGCGGGDSGSSPSPSGGTGGDAGEDGEGGKAVAGKGGKGGSTAGAPAVEAGAAGMAGESNTSGAGGEGGAGTPAQNNSAVSFVTTGVVSKSKSFILISGLGESLGGTVGSKRAKSLKYTYIPGVIAASSP